MTADWTTAQVIEATTRDGRFALSDYSGKQWISRANWRIYRIGDLSDVRVVVDAAGNVAAPEITDEDLAIAAANLGVRREGLRAALSAALNPPAGGDGRG